ncbi:MAG: thioredoxin domain-containing protein [Candidatus Omnitrophica bacterium]|nr:thioredoxin domain-containing protein [Candidatus Omnitrophota bacterium]MDD5670308.1 thioredoxin domain-containing protein [Candidatus Omnitrophota bacterium]
MNVRTLPSLGPAQAPITIEEFSDFQCPFCRKGAATMKKVMANYPQDVRWVFRHFPLSKTPGRGSFLTHEASVCADEQGKFWEFRDGILALPYGSQKADLERIAKSIGLNLSQFQDCLDSGKYDSFLLEEQREGLRRGMTGAPAFFVNHKYALAGAYPYEYFDQLIQTILKSKRKSNGLIPNAEAAVSDVTVPEKHSGRPSQGPPDAPVTLVEFNDFHCPYCRQTGPVIDRLMEKYEGKIQRVWRHFPLPMHREAFRTHEASECASEQNKFWDFYHALYAMPGNPRSDQTLLNIAGTIGLDQNQFQVCLESDKYSKRIREDLQEGSRLGVEGTPTLFVNGEMIAGAVSYEELDQIVQSELEAKKPGNYQ